MRFSRLVFGAAVLFLAGCASTQLNYNALEIAGTVDDLLSSQIAHNLAKFIKDTNAIPSQVAIPSGSVTTTNQIGASWADPVTKAFTLTRGAAVGTPFSPTQAVAGANTITPSASDQWSQNWSLAPVTDSDQIRRLATLYRYVTNPGSVDLCRDYPLVETQGSVGSNQNTAADAEDDRAWQAVANSGPDTINKVPQYRAYREAYSHPGKPAKHDWAASRIIAQIQSGAVNQTDPYETGWTDALDTDTLDSYSTYLKAHAAIDQNRPHVQEARDRIKLLLQAAGKKPSPPAGGQQSNQSYAIETADGSITATATDALFLKEPSCILCSKKTNAKNISRSPAQLIAQNTCRINKDSDLYINPRLRSYWLIYSTSAGEFFQVTPNGPTLTSGEGLYRIGTSGGITLYTRDTRAYNEFILFILEATAQGSTAGQSGKNTPSGRGQAAGQVPAAATIPLTSQ
jgi:Tfp pilus assembly protein FimT